jgi:hypothetical protein
VLEIVFVGDAVASAVTVVVRLGVFVRLCVADTELLAVMEEVMVLEGVRVGEVVIEEVMV